MPLTRPTIELARIVEEAVHQVERQLRDRRGAAIAAVLRVHRATAQSDNRHGAHR